MGSVVVASLYPGILQRAIPFGELPVRARTFELCVGAGVEKTASDTTKGLLAGRFDDLWLTGPWPVLLLNGISVNRGNQIVTSHLNLADATEGPYLGLQDIRTFRQESDITIATSTAGTNTARFPYASPPGTIKAHAKDARAVGQIVDGGVFENYGAQTALEVYERIVRDHPQLDVGVLQSASDLNQQDPGGSCSKIEKLPALATQRTPDSECLVTLEHGLTINQPAAGTPEHLDLGAALQKLRVPSVSIALINHGEMAWVRAFGGSSTRTLYQAASMSKLVTAVAALRLVQQGRLTLDREVNTELVSWHTP